MKIVGEVIAYKRKGDSGLPEITIAISHMKDKVKIPTQGEVELDLKC